MEEKGVVGTGGDIVEGHWITEQDQNRLGGVRMSRPAWLKWKVAIAGKKKEKKPSRGQGVSFLLSLGALTWRLPLGFRWEPVQAGENGEGIKWKGNSEMETDRKTEIKKTGAIQCSLTLQEYGSWSLLGSINQLRLAAKTLIRRICLIPVDREEVEK